MAGTVTVEQTTDRKYTKITLVCTADAADASFPNTNIITRRSLVGTIKKIVYKPGGVAPTPETSVSLEDPRGVDILGRAGSHIGTAAKQFKPITDGTVQYYAPE